MNRTELEELFTQTQRASQNAYTLLDDLLSWAANQMNHGAFSPLDFDLHATILRAVEQKQIAAEQKSIRLVYYEKPKLRCFGDPHMIGTILRNFIANAIKFTPRGGRVSVHARCHPNFTFLAVSDTGVGMSQDQITDLFRIDKKTKSYGTDGEQGSGLGLKICKQLIDKHNGEICVRSRSEKGSTFAILIPNLSGLC